MGVAAALLIGFLIFGGGDTNIHITDSTDVTVSVEGAEIPDITATDSQSTRKSPLPRENVGHHKSRGE